MRRILHEFVVLHSALPRAKPQTRAIYGHIMHSYVSNILYLFVKHKGASNRNEEPGKGNYRMESTIILLPLKPVQGCIWEGGRAPPLGLHRPTDLKY